MKKIFVLIGLLIILASNSNTVFCQKIGIAGFQKGSNFDKNTERFLLVFDTKTLEIIKKIPIGVFPSKLTVVKKNEGEFEKIFVASRENGITVVNLRTEQLKTILEDEIIRDIESDKEGNVYALNFKNEVFIINSSNLKVKNKIKLVEGNIIQLVKPNKDNGVYIFRNDRELTLRKTTSLVQKINSNGVVKTLAVYELGFNSLINSVFVKLSIDDNFLYALGLEELFRFNINDKSIEQLNSGIFEQDGIVELGQNLSVDKKNIFIITAGGTLNVIAQKEGNFETINDLRGVFVQSKTVIKGKNLFVNIYDEQTNNASLVLINIPNRQVIGINNYENFETVSIGDIILLEHK